MKEITLEEYNDEFMDFLDEERWYARNHTTEQCADMFDEIMKNKNTTTNHTIKERIDFFSVVMWDFVAMSQYIAPPVIHADATAW